MKPILIICFLSMMSCQFPVANSVLPETQKFLVIDAQVTENYLRLNVIYSLLNVTSTGVYNLPNPPTSKAYIIDSKGIQYTIKNTRGLIDTTFKGKVGETYQLFVEADGKNYVSGKETMRFCPEIDTVASRYQREEFRSPKDELYDGFDVYAEVRDAPGVDNFYQWESINYTKATYCDRIFSQVEQRDLLVPCNPSTCWNINRNLRVLAESDKLRDGKPIVKQILRVPFALPPRYYYLRVEQRAITPSVFNYLNAVENKGENLGTLFDTPAQTSFNPNVHNVQDKGEKILGAFSVFSYRYRILNIDMMQTIPGAQVKYVYETASFVSDPFLNRPCIEGPGRTQIKPEGWIE